MAGLTWGLENEKRRIWVRCGNDQHSVVLDARNGLEFPDHHSGPVELAVESFFLEDFEGGDGCYALARWWERKGLVFRSIASDYRDLTVSLIFNGGRIATVGNVPSVSSLARRVTIEAEEEEGLHLLRRIVFLREKGSWDHDRRPVR